MTQRVIWTNQNAANNAFVFPKDHFLMIRRPPRSTLSSSSAASDVYKRQDLSDDGGFTPLMLASKWSSLPFVSFLIEQPGIEIDKKNKREETALTFATWKDNLDMVQLLVDAGALLSIERQNLQNWIQSNTCNLKVLM